MKCCLRAVPGSLGREWGALLGGPAMPGVQSGDSTAWDGCKGHGRTGRSELHAIVPLVADDPIRLLREVVLLTDDRNLRVKALTRNVPVRDIPTFLKWAQEG